MLAGIIIALAYTQMLASCSLSLSWAISALVVLV
jgi:hypothetical protein